MSQLLDYIMFNSSERQLDRNVMKSSMSNQNQTDALLYDFWTTRPKI